MNIRRLLSVNWLKSLILSCKNSCKSVIYNNVAVHIDQSAIIQSTGMFEMGRRYYQEDNRTSGLCIGKNARLIVDEDEQIYSGAYITVSENAVLHFGGGYCNHNLTVDCFESISIGKGVIISKNVTIRDSDNHNILSSDFEKTKPIVIKDHVWIGMNVTILKGVTIGEGSVIAAGSIVTKDIPEHCLAAGVPCRVKKKNIIWE